MSHGIVKVKIEKFTEKSENQQSVTIIFSGKEIQKIHLLC